MAERIRGRAGQKLRKQRLQRTNGLCEDCLAQGRTSAAKTPDHIIPLAHGGDDIDSNTRNLCGPCHAKRTAEQFGHKIKQEIGTDGWPVA